jgi:hypothetical protein
MASGGLACMVGVVLIVIAFPALAAFDVEHAEAQMAEAAA